jgi:hypothetical protein
VSASISAAKCPNCGELRILPGATFCDRCGAQLPEGFFAQQELAEEREAEALRTRVASLEARNRELESLRSSEVDSEKARSGALQEQVKGLEALRVRLVDVEAENSELKRRVTEAEERAQETATKQFVPRAKSIIRLSRRQLYLGISLVAFGVMTMLAGAATGTLNLAGLGLASFLIGLLVVYLPSQAALPPELVEASLISPLADLERVLRELSPNTKAVYLGMQDRLQTPLVFLPLADKHGAVSSLPSSDYDRFMVMDAKDSSRNGLLLEAPGASLLSYMEREAGVDFFDLSGQDLIGTLRSCMVDSLEVAAELKGEVAPDGVRFRIKDGVLGRMSQSVVKSAGNVSSRLGCPICSAGICAAVKVLKREVEVDKATHEAGYHSVNLTYNGGVAVEAH